MISLETLQVDVSNFVDKTSDGMTFSQEISLEIYMILFYYNFFIIYTMKISLNANEK